MVSAPSPSFLRSGTNPGRHSWWFWAVGLAGGLWLGGGLAAPARAQALDTYFPNGVPGYDNGLGVTVLTRERPGYESPVFHVGNAEISPQVSEQVGYNDNIYGSIHPIGSFVAETRASVLANSVFNSSNVGGSVSVQDYRYPSSPSLDTTTGTAALGGGFDIGRDHLALAYSFAAENENPGDIATSGFDRPIQYYVNRFQTNYALNLNRVVLTPALEFDTWRYDNTRLGNATVVETYRNRDVVQGSLTGRYKLSDVDSLIVVAAVSNAHYVTPVRGILAPDNDGYTVLAGVDFTPSGLWSYRALAGYEVRTYASSKVSTQASPVAQVSATFTPSGLTTVTGTFSRTIEDAAEADAVGYTYTTGRLRVDQEFLRNIILTGQVTYQRADYIPSPLQASGSQSITDFGGAVTWLLNRYARVVASYDLAYNGNQPINGVSQNNFRNLTLVQLQLGRFDPLP
jgi:hypothetical protein